ncbi:MAG: aminoacyl-tRNA hydrolase [Actinomycetota bacterium]
MVWLVVGLGNPGDEYSSTRHNIGQMVVEVLADRNKARWTTHKSRTDVAAFKIGVRIDAASVIIAKSRSYMNESGGPIKALAAFYKIEPSKIIVIHDELDIPFSAIRVKLAGGDNGHNGLKSLTSSFATSNFYRIRMGIGRPIGQQDPADFVLKPFSSAEKKVLPEFLLRGAEAVESLITQGLEITQQNFNT